MLSFVFFLGLSATKSWEFSCGFHEDFWSKGQKTTQGGGVHCTAPLEGLMVGSGPSQPDPQLWVSCTLVVSLRFNLKSR